MSDSRWLGKAAVLWALDEAPDVPAELVAALVALARHAGEDGRSAYASASTIAGHIRKSTRSAQRDIAALERLGLITRGDQRLVLPIRADKRPVVYDLAMRHDARDAPQPKRYDSGDAPQRYDARDAGKPKRYDTRGATVRHSGRSATTPASYKEILKISGTARAPLASADALAPPRAGWPVPTWCTECDEATRRGHPNEDDPELPCPVCSPEAVQASCRRGDHDPCRKQWPAGTTCACDCHEREVCLPCQEGSHAACEDPGAEWCACQACMDSDLGALERRRIEGRPVLGRCGDGQCGPCLHDDHEQCTGLDPNSRCGSSPCECRECLDDHGEDWNDIQDTHRSDCRICAAAAREAGR